MVEELKARLARLELEFEAELEHGASKDDDQCHVVTPSVVAVPLGSTTEGGQLGRQADGEGRAQTNKPGQPRLDEAPGGRTASLSRRTAFLGDSTRGTLGSNLPAATYGSPRQTQPLVTGGATMRGHDQKTDTGTDRNDLI